MDFFAKKGNKLCIKGQKGEAKMSQPKRVNVHLHMKA